MALGRLGAVACGARTDALPSVVTPAVEPADPSNTQNSLERVLAAYRAALAAGAAVDADVYAQMLATDDLRRLFFAATRTLADELPQLAVAPNTVFAGRYELLEPIGSGGMGQVWRARDHTLGHEVAVKVLNALATAAIDVDRLVERESRLLAQLTHPGIVRVLDAGRDGEHRFLVMELIGGRPLDGVIDALRAQREQRGSIAGADLLVLLGHAGPGRQDVVAADDPWPIAATKILVELLRTLEATHGVGVVHRDLKPGNVRLVGGGLPVLLDFGLGFDAGAAPGRLTREMFGTTLYAAPEQWEGTERVGVHTDIWQAGVVFYELLVLQSCFSQPSPVDAMQAIRSGDFVKPRARAPDIDARLEACVLRAMDVDPRRRYHSAAEFRTDLERHLAGETPLAAATLRTAAWRVRAFARRHRTAIGLTTAAALGALTVAWWPRTPVSWNAERIITVRLDAPARMLALRIGRGADGRRYCAPLVLRAGGRPGAAEIAPSLPAGETELNLEDVGEAARFAESFVSTILVDVVDDAAMQRFGHAVDAVRQARRLVEARSGEWLTEQEFFGLLQPGRGGGGDLSSASLLEPGSWQRDGLRGYVLAR